MTPPPQAMPPPPSYPHGGPPKASASPAPVTAQVVQVMIYLISPGLILVIFLTEPVGLAPRNLTEPDGKTMSPEKTLCQILL